VQRRVDGGDEWKRGKREGNAGRAEMAVEVEDDGAWGADVKRWTGGIFDTRELP